ncbi:MAG: hypothetical protein EOM20_19520 [Spartobacteria bacterium]|nr:hypothetical protein [Spartobacteria bacterium]
MSSKKVKRTERGWAGHFCCSYKCLFHRNTLLECGDVKIVVSTVGFMKYKNRIETIGHKRYFETMAFHSDPADERYYDIDVTRQVTFSSPWAISEVDADDKANDMHEAVVKEITKRLRNGEVFNEND